MKLTVADLKTLPLIFKTKISPSSTTFWNTTVALIGW